MDAMMPQPGAMLALAPLLAGPAPMSAPVTHDVTVVTTRKMAQARVLGVPPEEFGIERNARDIKTCNYCFHDIVTKTEADLIAEGYDAAQIKGLPDYTGFTNTEETARDTVWETSGSGATSSNPSTRLVRITEHYVRMDYEGNVKPGLYMVCTGGDQGEVLRKDKEDCVYPIDAIPFAATTPVPVTHRFFGRSIADLVMPLQLQKTAMKRGALDNLYLHNNPRVEVPEANAGPNTLDDLLVSRPGGVVRTKTGGGLQWQVVPDITGSVYPMLQYLDAELEARTGVAKQTQGIDANALQNQSATAVAQVFSASQMRVKLIARIMAEGVRDIFSLLHGTVRKHGQKQETVRLRNTWVDVNPRDWKTRSDMTINVGLGNGGKAQQFAQTMALANVQKEIVANGMTNVVDPGKIYNTAAELTKIMGHKNPDKFFNDPDAKNPETGQPMYPPPAPKPSPEEVKGQVQMAIADKQSQLDAAADQRKAQIETTQAQADIATQDRKTNAEMVQSEREYQLKEKLAVLEFDLQRQLKMAELEMQREMHQQTLAHQQQSHQQQMEAGVFKVAAGAEAHEQKMEQGAAAAKAKPKGSK